MYTTALRKQVIDLQVGDCSFNNVGRYKRFIAIAPYYPGDESAQFVKQRIKKAFIANRNKTNEDEIKNLLNRGEFVYKEVEALIRLKKYRTLDKRYSSHRQQDDLITYYLHNLDDVGNH